MNKIILAFMAMLTASIGSASVGPQINGNQISSTTAITISTLAVPGEISISTGSGIVVSSGISMIGSQGWLVGQSSVTASAFFGNGNALTALNAANLTGAVPTGSVNLSTVTTAFATKASSGTNADLRALLGAGSGISISTQITETSSATFTGATAFLTSNSSITASAFFGNGANLTGISTKVHGGQVVFAVNFTFTVSGGTSDFGHSVTGSTITFTVVGTTVECSMGLFTLYGTATTGDNFGIVVDGSPASIPGQSNTGPVPYMSTFVLGNTSSVSVTGSIPPVQFQVTPGTHNFYLAAWGFTGNSMATNSGASNFQCKEVQEF